MLDLKDCLEKARSWALNVGELQKSRFRGDFAIDRKTSQIDLVTEIDRLSEQKLKEFIEAEYPNHSILGEETGLNDKHSDYCWIIDPLDGTTNYAHGLPIYCISIALQLNRKTIIGVVYAPMTGQMFTAIKGQGAFLNEEKINVSNCSVLNQSVLGTGFPYDRATNPDNNAHYTAHMIPKVRDIRRMGSAAYDLAMVASGALDAYWELNLNTWDVEAGILMVEEAGGVVIPWEEKRGVAIIAGNAAMVEKVKMELAFVDLHMSVPPIT